MSHIRKAEDNRRLRRLVGKTKHSGVRGVYEYDGRYYRYCPCSRRSRYYRSRANRVVRRNGEPLNRGMYRKVYDLWWELD